MDVTVTKVLGIDPPVRSFEDLNFLMPRSPKYDNPFAWDPLLKIKGSNIL